MWCNSATKIATTELRFPENIYFDYLLYSFQTFTGVVDLHSSFWLQPHVWLASFYHFQQNHRCGWPAFFILNKTTGVVSLLFPIWPKPQMWATVSSSLWLTTVMMNSSHRIRHRSPQSVCQHPQRQQTIKSIFHIGSWVTIPRKKSTINKIRFDKIETGGF